MPTDIAAMFCFLRVHNIAKTVCQMFCRITCFRLFHVQALCNCHNLQPFLHLAYQCFYLLQKHIQTVFIFPGIKGAVIVMGNLVDVYTNPVDFLVHAFQFLADFRVIPGTVGNQHTKILGIRKPHLFCLFL